MVLVYNIGLIDSRSIYIFELVRGKYSKIVQSKNATLCKITCTL